MDESWIREQAKSIIGNFEKNGKTSKKELSKTFWKRFGTPRRTKKIISQIIEIFNDQGISINCIGDIFGKESEDSWVILSVKDNKSLSEAISEGQLEEVDSDEFQTGNLTKEQDSLIFRPLEVKIDNKPQITNEQNPAKTAFIKNNPTNKSCIILLLILGIPIFCCYLLSFKRNSSGNGTNNNNRQQFIVPLKTQIPPTFTYVISTKTIVKPQTKLVSPTSNDMPTSIITPTLKPSISKSNISKAPYFVNKKWKVIRATDYYDNKDIYAFYQDKDGRCTVSITIHYVSEDDGKVYYDDPLRGACILTKTIVSYKIMGGREYKWKIEDQNLYLQDTSNDSIMILEEMN